MLVVPKEKILENLGDYPRQALEIASERSIEESGFEVTTGHYLLALLTQPATDAARILSNQQIDVQALTAKVRKSFDFLKRGSTELPQFSSSLLELLQDAWLISTSELNESAVKTGAVLAAFARAPDKYTHYYYFDDIKSLSDQVIVNNYAELTRGSVERGDQNSNGEGASAQTKPLEAESALAKFGRNITDEAREGKIDPVFCRDDEISLMTDVLSRRRKNNPILVGEPGVGKTAVAEGLALKIIEDDVPQALQGAVLWELDMGALSAGASVKGEFERRLKAVIDEVLNSSEKIVLFIDEAHTLIGGGGQAGGADAANLLKPALARGNLRAIAATTWSEYKKYFEKDAALSRRFQLIKLDEPTIDHSVTILRGLRDRYEQLHGVYISDEALHAASAMSARYITGRQLPDKALDVIDTASVRVAAALSAKPAALARMENRVGQLQRARDAQGRDKLLRASSDAGDNISTIDSELEKLATDLEALNGQWQAEREIADRVIEIRGQIVELNQGDRDNAPQIESLQNELEGILNNIATKRARGEWLVEFEVGPSAVAKVIADWTGVPITSMNDDELERILGLGDELRSTIKGQDEAIDRIQERLKLSRLDLGDEAQPRGVFLLVGPSGVGKTETALQVANRIYGGDQFLTTINMSEYQEKHTVSRLIGSPPGYVGFGEGGVLSEAIRKTPYSVVLLDEVEKAHPDVMDIFYQVFDKGVLFDGEGRQIDCSNVAFFLTSNLGSDAVMQNREQVAEASLDTLEASIRPHLEQHFKPALIARMKVLLFKPLTDDVLREIVELKLGRYASRMEKKRGFNFKWDENVESAIMGLCAHSENGARGIDQAIDRWIMPSIIEESLSRQLATKPLTDVVLSVVDEGFDFEFLPKPEAEKTKKKAPSKRKPKDTSETAAE